MTRRFQQMSVEQCAARMERFLSSKPRSQKTLRYLKTLPKIERRRVSVEEYEFARDAAAKVVARAQAASDAAVVVPHPPVRKLRLRPKARVKSKWACRPKGYRHVVGIAQRCDYPPRDPIVGDAQRAVLSRAQSGLCALCGEPFGQERPTIDHSIPKFMGGADALGNLVAAHGECNVSKANDAPTGCELIWLLAVNARLDMEPRTW